MAATGTSTHPSAPKPASSARDRDDSPFARLAEAVATAQAHLNNPKAEKTSTRREPVRLVPAPDESRRPRVSTVRQAKNYLRATRSPEFLRSAPDLQRHGRKCAICHHPEREMLEELFIHWHSPQAIANFFRDYSQINWVSIYRHAYALGLDEIRRRNLRHFFENLLDDAIEATPTFAGVLGAARALGCVTEDGRWVEPEKRILMTTVVRHEDPSATTTTDPDSVAPESTECAHKPFTSLPEAAFNNPAHSAEQFGSPTKGRQPQDVLSPSLPQAAVDPSATAPQTPPSGQPRFVRARFQPCRKQPPNRAASAAEVPRPRHERNVSPPSSSLPKAAVNSPAAALQTPPSGQPFAAREYESVAAPATSLPEAAVDQPATAQQTPPGFSGAPSAPTSHEPRVTEHARPSASREIRPSLNVHKTKHKQISNR